MDLEQKKDIDNVIFSLIKDLDCTTEKVEDTLAPLFDNWSMVEATYSYISLNDYYKEFKKQKLNNENEDLIKIVDKYYDNIFKIANFYRKKKRIDKINKYML